MERIALMYPTVHFAVHQLSSAVSSALMKGDAEGAASGSSAAEVARWNVHPGSNPSAGAASQLVLECRRSSGLRQSFGQLFSPHMANAMQAVSVEKLLPVSAAPSAAPGSSTTSFLFKVQCM
jgi:hypothetical protein